MAKYGIIGLVTFLLFLWMCSTEKTSQKRGGVLLSKNIDSAVILPPKNLRPFNCSKCKYTVPEKTYEVDGRKLNIHAGDFICLNAALKYGPLKFTNLKGKPGKPISIVNCGGKVHIKIDSNHTVGIRMDNCQYFKFSGIKDHNNQYGIAISGAKKIGLSLEHLSSNFEIENIEIYNVGFVGIMAKTDPDCDDATIRGHFTMYDVLLHDNYIHDTKGEGFYIGNSFYEGFKTKCGTRLPHDIVGLKVYRNIVKNSGWDGIQVGGASKGAEVYNNSIENYGTENASTQNNGIQIGIGTGGLCYNNLINKGTGNGIIVLGLGDNVVFNNIIIKAGSHGIFCDERYTPGEGFNFINNTIINPKGDGIRIYAEKVAKNVIINNVIVNPATLKEYPTLSTKNAYVYTLNDDVKIDLTNNFFTEDISTLHFKDTAKFDYRFTKASPLLDAGRDAADFNVTFDFMNTRRPKGKAYDIGAYEY